jgi:hypothetical protein
VRADFILIRIKDEVWTCIHTLLKEFKHSFWKKVFDWLASAGFCWERLIDSIINLEVSDEFSRSCVRSWFFPGCFLFGQCQNFHRSPECPGFRKV